MGLKELLARQQEIVDAAKAEQRDLNNDEQREFNALQSKIDNIKSKDSTGNNSNGNPVPNNNTEEIQRQAMQTERQRALDIENLCREFNEDSSGFIKDGSNIDQVRAFILEKQIKDKKPSSVGVDITLDAKDKFRAVAVDGFLLRAGFNLEKPVEGANQMRGMSLKELAKETAHIEGVQNAYRLSEDELLRQYMTPTSLFTGILDQTARTVFEQAYTDAETTYQLWTKRGSLKDFRPTKSYQVGTAGELLLVPESGELKHDQPNAEEGPQRQLLTFGRQFTMSRQAFINDDIDFISTMPAAYAQSARLGVNRLVYQMLAKNPAVWDGNALFSTEHGNIAETSGKPSVESVSDMRMKLRKQKAAGGTVNLNIPAKFMLVPTALETMAGQFIGSTVDPAQTNPNIKNPFFNSLQIISDAELDDASQNGMKEWYITSDQFRSPIQVDYLNGVDMPTIVMKQPPAGQLGYMWDIYIDYGVTVVDYKTVIKNNG